MATKKAETTTKTATTATRKKTNTTTTTRKRTTTRKKVADNIDNLIEVVVTEEGKYIKLSEFAEKSNLTGYSHDTVVDIITNTEHSGPSLKVQKVTKEKYEANKILAEEYFKDPEKPLINAFKTKFGNYVLVTDILTAASIFMPYNLEAILKMGKEDFIKYVLSLPAIEEYCQDITFDEYAASFASIANVVQKGEGEDNNQ